MATKTAEEHLKQDVGVLMANLLFQIAVLKAENEQLRAAAAARNGQPATEPLAPSA